jgi:hypothetical protein
MNHILNRMHEVMVEIQQIMTNEIVMNSPQMKQNLEDMQKNMGTLIMEMDGFLGNFEQVRKHQEQLKRNNPLTDFRKDYSRGGYDVA